MSLALQPVPLTGPQQQCDAECQATTIGAERTDEAKYLRAMQVGRQEHAQRMQEAAYRDRDDHPPDPGAGTYGTEIQEQGHEQRQVFGGVTVRAYGFVEPAGDFCYNL